MPSSLATMGQRDARLWDWYCCHCRFFWSGSLYRVCVNCNHQCSPCCRLIMAQKRPDTRAEPQIERIPQTQRQDTVPLSTDSADGQDICKVSTVELSPRRALGLLNNKYQKNRGQAFRQSQVSLSVR